MNQPTPNHTSDRSVNNQRYVTPSQQSISNSSSNSGSSGQGHKPHELFVGNLSFFCEERHLFELFDQYTRVNGVRVMRNELRTRSLMFGFVTLSCPHDANEMARVLNGTFFMGRRMTVAISGGRTHDDYCKGGTPVHISFVIRKQPSSTEQPTIRPTESWLRKNFTPYGIILDCQVKDYQWIESSYAYEGYGFMIFSRSEDAMRIVEEVQRTEIDGIQLTCKLGYEANSQNRQFHSPSNESLAIQPFAAVPHLPEQASQPVHNPTVPSLVSPSPSPQAMLGPAYFPHLVYPGHYAVDPNAPYTYYAVPPAMIPAGYVPPTSSIQWAGAGGPIPLPPTPIPTQNVPLSSNLNSNNNRISSSSFLRSDRHY